MRIEVRQSFDDYINGGDETTRVLLANGGLPIEAARSYYKFFTESLWAGEAEIAPVPAVIAMNAFMLYLGGTRMAMTGHVSAIFPILRASLESACYAFLMTEDRSLETVWAERHTDPGSRALCRKSFAPAVRVTVDRLNTIQPGSGDWILEAYEAAIDHGAHPNPLSVLRHIGITEEGDKFNRVSLTALYSHDARELAAGLVACLEYGLAIANILFRCRKKCPALTVAHLYELNDIKERVVAELVGD